MEVSLAKRFILSVSMHGGRYFFIQPKILCPSKIENELPPLLCFCHNIKVEVRFTSCYQVFVCRFTYFALYLEYTIVWSLYSP